MKFFEKMNAKQHDLQANPGVTIAFLGDSVTQGCFEVYKTGPETLETVFEPQHAYSARLREMLAVLYPNVQVNIINSGISGDSAPSGAKRLERDVLRYCPDLVVVSYGLNDATNGLAGLNAYVDALTQIFSRLQQQNIPCIFLTENMMNTYVSCHLHDPFFIKLAEELAALEADGVLGAYFDAAKQAAAQYGVRVCDCYAKWRALAQAGVDTTALLANHLNHPTREMVSLFAVSLLETMLS